MTSFLLEINNCGYFLKNGIISTLSDETGTQYL
jgi:hypothetical protein